jgi:hypothetical protein
MIIQVTLISDGGRRPLSALIECDSWQEYQANKARYRDSTIMRILAARHMTLRDAQKYGYNTVKARVYDREQIARENAERYANIKKEKGWE